MKIVRLESVALVALMSVFAISCSSPAPPRAAQGMFSQTAPDGSRCLPGIPNEQRRLPDARGHAGMVWIPGGEFSMGFE